MISRTILLIALMATTVAVTGGLRPAAAARVAEQYTGRLNCSRPSVTCRETAYNRVIWPHRYVGHDEPGVGFLSNVKGSGNRMQYTFKLPTDPPSQPAPGRSYNFQLGGAFWFGMIMCDTQGDPEQVSTCTPDSDINITSLVKHPGSAYMEMQFYAPGYVDWPDGYSCNGTQWCAALNIDSFSYNPLTDQSLNDACASSVGTEYVNFAFITKNGQAQAPANPIQGNVPGAFAPDPKKALFMNSGDRIKLQMFDTTNGLKIAINDSTSGQAGSMTASKANGFAQVKFAPNPSVECTPIPYDFHPMYSTSSAKTILPWGATQDNVEFVDEIGHFDWCSGGSSKIKATGNCPSDGYEGIGANRASDYDDTYCFPGSASSLVKIGGCEGTNVPGNDGASYLADWPDGNTNLHPGPTTFSSPATGAAFNRGYRHAVLISDLPALEPAIQCNIHTGAGCSHFPLTDAGTPAAFYPFFATIPSGKSCIWSLGNDIPGVTTNDYGGNAQYGPPQPVTFLKHGGGGKTVTFYTAFRHVLPKDPCANNGG